MPKLRRWLTATLPWLLGGCLGLPPGVAPVKGFELDRYLGTWYEIARLDHRFERGLVAVSAEYSRRDDGGVRVVNRGYDPGQGRWKQAEGRAYFVRESDEGYLKVSFFGPFYGSYAVFELDRDAYAYAFVTSSSTDYLWLLARTPTVSETVRDRFVARARELGFAADRLIFVDQQRNLPRGKATP